MAGMGDLRAGECTKFSRRLEALQPVRDKPTLDENDFYVPSPREEKLAAQVCVENCVVSLATENVRRQLCLTAIQATRAPLTVISGQRIDEDEDFAEYLRILLPVEVRAVSSASSWPQDGFKGVCLVKPDILLTVLSRDTRNAARIGVLVLRDFEHYLDPSHAYRKTVACFQDERGKPTATRVLALADGLRVCSLDSLECDLKRLRTPLKLTCCLGTPERPHKKETTVEVCFIQENWTTQVGDVVSSSVDPEVQDVGTTLRERGIVAALSQAEEAVAAKPKAELRDFLQLSYKHLTRLKGTAAVNHIRGKTLVLVNTVAGQRRLKNWIQGQPSVMVIEKPNDAHTAPAVVMVATTTDMPTLKQYSWNTVILADLPFGVSCDALLSSADFKVALATEPEWKHWKEALDLHDDIEKILQRVNE